ncbi:MAG: tetratricopeptide repeat protein [Fimbriimonadales bacterium]|nr:tetratricopeptide repeat protein [Fimbriimonadales bacterium]
MAGFGSWRKLAGLVLAFAAAGCRLPPPPDPNDPGRGANVDPDVLQRNLKHASDFLNERVLRGEISDRQAREMMAAIARRMVEGVDLRLIPVSQAWRYGEFFRAAKEWDEALACFRVAVRFAKNEDRRVNDSLRLAHCLAELGRTDEAIAAARSVFDTRPEESAPILPAVLLEIVPASLNRGRDVELARLLEDAIAIHERTVVDPETAAGMAFLAARPHHVRNAYALAIRLYRAGGRDDLAAAAAERAAVFLRSAGRG